MGIAVKKERKMCCLPSCHPVGAVLYDRSFVSLVGLESAFGAAEFLKKLEATGTAGISWSLEASGAATISWSLKAFETIGAVVGAISWSFEALRAVAPFFALFVGIFAFSPYVWYFFWLPWPFLSPI